LRKIESTLLSALLSELRLCLTSAADLEVLAPELTPESDFAEVDFAEVDVVQPSSFRSLDVRVSLFESGRFSSHSATEAPCPFPPKSVISRGESTKNGNSSG